MKQFILNRLNKDNLWNLVFWIGMSLGVFSSLALGEMYKKGETMILPMVIMVSTIIGLPFLIKRFSKVIILNKTSFLTNSGRKLNIDKNMPNLLIIVVSTIAITALTGANLDKSSYVLKSIDTLIVLSVFFGIPTLCFILKNCPIAILFNSKFYKFEPHHSGYRKKRDDSRYYSPMYKSLSGNIYHRNR